MGVLRQVMLVVYALFRACSLAVAAPSAAQCKPDRAVGHRQISGSTYTWVKDIAGMSPSAGAVVRLDFFGGVADVDATNGNGGPTVWTESYGHRRKISISVTGAGLTINATISCTRVRAKLDVAVRPDERHLVAVASRAEEDRHADRARRVHRHADEAVVLATGRPGHVELRQGLPVLGHDARRQGAQLSPAVCGLVRRRHVEARDDGSRPCFSSLENKVALSNFNGLEDIDAQEARRSHGQLVTDAQPSSFARCVAEANLQDAEAAETALFKRGSSTRAQEDAVERAVTTAPAALAAVAAKDDPTDARSSRTESSRSTC